MTVEPAPSPSLTERPRSARLSSAPVEVVALGRIGYLEALERQRALAADRAEGVGNDTLLLLEHPPVYTAGRRTAPEDMPTDGTPVIEVDRGGKITWHGPGQLVGYPIVRLAEPIDVVGYVRRIEEALIEVCSHFGLRTGRVDGRSGVWLPAAMTTDSDGAPVWRPERKIAAIGVRVQRGVALHGFAINCDNDLGAFDAIVPCGITDAGVTSLSVELKRDVPVEEVQQVAAEAVIDALNGILPVAVHEIERLTLADYQASVFRASEPHPTPMPKVTTFRFG